VIPCGCNDGFAAKQNHRKELKSTMTKNGKFFTFLFTVPTKSRIYIKRIEISRSLVQNGLLGCLFLIGIFSFGYGIYGVFGGFDFINTETFAASASPIPNKLSVNISQKDTIDYSRPQASADFVFNAGGPPDADGDADEPTELEKQLELIAKTSNPANIPSIWAHTGKINNEFGFRRNPFGGRTYEFHAGMDIDGERGQPIIAPANGVVTKAGWHGGYGNLVEIDHGNGLITRYGHLSRIDVQVGDQLTRGQQMGLVGSTGRSTGPHLHYELRLGDKPINPRHFLPPEPVEIRRLNG
jgi:murein DD-endopeptidase MepM/ murein hydrolase activator NlpD